METNQKKVLIIDDDEMILQSLTTMLLKDSFEVLNATDGDAGLVEALNKEPDLIITDIEMKKVSGMEVLKEIRKYGPWGAKAPIIILTNYDADEEIMKGIIADSPSLYILKSKVNPQIILDKVKELLNI